MGAFWRQQLLLDWPRARTVRPSNYAGAGSLRESHAAAGSTGTVLFQKGPAIVSSRLDQASLCIAIRLECQVLNGRDRQLQGNALRWLA